MSRLFKWTLIGVLALVAAALIALIIAPSSPLAAALMIAATIPFLALIPYIFVRAWRTKGWSIRHPGRFDARTPLE
jgi:hypothetical protein